MFVEVKAAKGTDPPNSTWVFLLDSIVRSLLRQRESANLLIIKDHWNQKVVESEWPKKTKPTKAAMQVTIRLFQEFKRCMYLRICSEVDPIVLTFTESVPISIVFILSVWLCYMYNLNCLICFASLTERKTITFHLYHVFVITVATSVW